MRTAVVTGAARGLGRAMAERLIADGFAVVALDSDADELQRAAAENGSRPVPLDVTDEAAVDAFAASLDGCDALVNNAAIWRFTRWRALRSTRPAAFSTSTSSPRSC